MTFKSHRRNIAKSMQISGRSEAAVMETYGAFLCIVLGLPRRDSAAYAKFVDDAAKPVR